MSKAVLSDKKMQERYMQEWFSKLQEADYILKEQMKSPESIIRCKLEMQKEPENFQFPLYFDNNIVYIHFRVSYLNELCRINELESEQIAIEEFIGNKQSIYWSPRSTDVESYAGFTTPIIIVPFLINNQKQLVINGNHRLTYAQKHKYTSIPSLCISANSLIDTKCFSSYFDILFYIFYNEIAIFSDLTVNTKAGVNAIIQASHLYQPDIHLDELLSIEI
jgi:hypothetical protein